MDPSQSVRDFLTQIAKDMKRDPKSFEPFIQKLEDEWFDTVSSLKMLPPTKFAELGFPARLQLEIQSRLAPAEEEKATLPVVQEPPMAPPEQKMAKPQGNEWERLLMAMRDEILVPEDQRKILRILKAMIENLLNFPGERKYRTIRLTNEAISKSIGKSKAAISFLTNLGFEMVNDELRLSDQGYNRIRLKNAAEAIDNINALYEERSDYVFDPYKPITTTLTGYKEIKSEEYEVDPVQKAIEAEKLKRKKAALTPITDREIKVFKIDPTQKISAGMEFLEKKSKVEAVPEDFEANLSYMRLKKENEEAQMFHNRAMKKLKKLRSTPVYSKGYIRFKFPDMHILQAAFSPSETIAFVYQFLKDYLVRKDKEFNLFVTPPKKILKPNKETLTTMGMLPYSIVYFEWLDPEVNKEGYLSREVIETYKSELNP